jgi:hypothetical protein
MDKLQAFIEKNRHLLDTEEPTENHFDRFSKRLAAQNPPKRVNLWLVAGAAAIAGIMLTASLSLLLNYNGIAPQKESGLAYAYLSPEIIQIDEYYHYQVTQKHLTINMLITGDLRILEDEITQTLKDMNRNHTSILNDLSLNPRPERAAFVLTRYYNAQLDVLDGIIQRIQSVSSMK